MKSPEQKCELKRKNLIKTFGKYRLAWADCTDDRRIFCNTYDIMLQALDEMELIELLYIWGAFTKEWKCDWKLLEEIRGEFKED